jgi:hypothetical protein
MSNKRIIMPKATSALVDDAIMDISDANRLLEPLLRAGDLSTVQRTSQAIIKLRNAIDSLKQVPKTYKTERSSQ